MFVHVWEEGEGGDADMRDDFTYTPDEFMRESQVMAARRNVRL